MDCVLHVAVSAGLAIATEEGVPNGTLLVPTADPCAPPAIAMRAISEPWLLHVPDAPRDALCMQPSSVAPLTTPLICGAPPPGTSCASCPEPGTVLEAATCADEERLRYARPVSRGDLETVRRVASAYERHFGTISLDKVPHSGFGTVGLPLARFLTATEIQAEWARERLTSESQREKAVVAIGATLGAGDAYVHFLGADPPYTDFWGSESLVTALIELAAGWYPNCLASGIAEADTRTCTLQVGDLGYYNATLPDPLGHSDHYLGKCADLRLFRNDGSRYEAWWNRPDDRDAATDDAVARGYSRALTRAFLGYATSEFDFAPVYFNDLEAIAGLARVGPAPGHDDHIHLCVP